MVDFVLIKKSLFEVKRPQKYRLRGCFLRYLFGKKKGTFLGQKVLFGRFCYQKGTFFGQKATFLIGFLTKKVPLIFQKGTDSDVLNF